MFWINNRDYDTWHVTYDNSLILRPRSNDVSLEIVSPKLEVKNNWEAEIDKVWEAVNDLFRVAQNSISCGSHIHVAPTARYFSLHELKQIAMATIIHEDCILKILHTTRRNHEYCRPNTSIEGTGLWYDFGQWKHRPGELQTRRVGLRDCNQALMGIRSKGELVAYMQGDDRRSLWNFRNVLSGETGTVEFRGGRHLRGPVRTKRWVTFAVLFVDFATRSPYMENSCMPQYVPPQWSSHNAMTEELWNDLKS
ncbi:putative amidoligase enzyme-domain-containing protein [Rhexocercosporidium sp. MPI-PUGE-AT-0058]|nr:putative amidoligase enzyme-domain-containing protein [Rhexocercosporidium sp. MPI-PUGE-AT-0058]